jgi:hypothetical protein
MKLIYYILLSNLYFYSIISGISFILNPIVNLNNINTNECYISNQLSVSNNANINQTLLINQNELFDINNNILILENNNQNQISFINLPIYNTGDYYLTLDQNNILSIYNPLLFNSSESYHIIIANNILSNTFNSLTINNNLKIEIGTSMSNVTIYGKKCILPNTINSTLSNLTISSNKPPLDIGGDITINNQTTLSGNNFIFTNLIINNQAIINQNLQLENNIEFKGTTNINGNQLNPSIITFNPINGIINFFNQNILCNNLNSSQSNNFLILDNSGLISSINISPINLGTIINTESQFLTIGSTNYNTNIDTNTNNNDNLEIVNFVIDTISLNTPNQPKAINFNINNITFKILTYDGITELKSQNLNINELNLSQGNHSSYLRFNHESKVFLNNFNIIYESLLVTNYYPLVLTTGEQVMVWKEFSGNDIEEESEKLNIDNEKIQNDILYFENYDDLLYYDQIISQYENNLILNKNILNTFYFYDKENKKLAYNEKNYVVLLYTLIKQNIKKYKLIEENIKNEIIKIKHFIYNNEKFLKNIIEKENIIKNELNKILEDFSI